ncbi:hypothetical protein NQZ68_031470 [Dissostichus eleginoides]|nr:hypothetical protein NQZ68_031470 [Dissostichus eleginoides]
METVYLEISGFPQPLNFATMRFQYTGSSAHHVGGEAVSVERGKFSSSAGAPRSTGVAVARRTKFVQGGKLPGSLPGPLGCHRSGLHWPGCPLSVLPTSTSV